MFYARLVFCSILLLSGSAAGQVTRIGDAQGLDLLKRMQGGWNLPCQSSGQGSVAAYTVLLAVSFTEFSFETREYYDSECLRQRASRKAEYRFVLGESHLTHDGVDAFAINFQQQSFEPGAFHLTPLNLIRVHQGRLFLAQAGDQDIQKRPKALDYTKVFSR